jgi:hypothetical protein
MPIERATSTLADATQDEREEILSVGDTLSLKLTEEKIKKVIGKRIEKGRVFWDKKLDLREVRKENEKRWLNQNLEVSSEGDLYDFQVPYKDNRIFVSVETLASNVVGKIPVPEVVEAQDTDASRELATNYGKVLYRKAEELFLKGKIQMVARHLLMGYRAGIIKTSWDFNAGELREDGYTGDIRVDYVRPHRIVIDEMAEDPDDIPLIAENMSATVEELGFRFPKKKDDLIDAIGGDKGTKVMMGSRIGYKEIWFSFLDEKGIKREGVCWRYGKDLLLDHGINPNFNYEDESEKSNFFGRPVKPYTFFNFLRIGRWVYDDTSLTEQAADLQDVLEKRGRQIVETADQAQGAKVFNTMQVDAGDAEKYTGDPRRNILAKGDARTAFFRVPPDILPRYVVEDKLDAREEIDNIFGTHAPLRGERTASPTLGQEVLSQRSDLGRQATLSESIERGALKVYQQMTQLYKVFAEEEHIVKYIGPDTGRTTFIKFSGDKIEDGIEVLVQAGSMKMDDKLTDRTEAVELAKIGGRIDPLTFFEKWHVDKPREKAKRLFSFLFEPDRYKAEVLEAGGEAGDQEAMATIQRINSGENVPPKENPSKEYLAYYNQFLQSPSFKQLPPEVQQLHIAHVRGTIEAAKGGLREPAEAPPEEAPPAETPPERRGGLMGRIGGLFGG